MSRVLKQYDVVYRKRRDKESPLQFLVMEGLNVDNVKYKFWKEIQKYDMYANPKFTIVNISLRKTNKHKEE